jgi:hypothetical protein
MTTGEAHYGIEVVLPKLKIESIPSTKEVRGSSTN